VGSNKLYSVLIKLYSTINVASILLIVLDMDFRTASPVSAADSFFFQLIPNYLKVEHGFAKTIKPNTTYRIAIFRGSSLKTKESREQMKWWNL